MINAHNSGHALPYNAIIECEARDTDGQIHVPAAMIEAFPEAEHSDGCAGTDCPLSYLTRYTRSYANVPGGGVRLEVRSEIAFDIEHHHGRGTAKPIARSAVAIGDVGSCRGAAFGL